MNWLYQIGRRVRVLFRKRSLEEEMQREIRFHLDMDEAANLRSGMTPREARRKALMDFGGVERFKEQARCERGGRLLDDLVQDLRFGWRSLKKRPLFTLAAVLTLALGIGGATTMYSVVNGVLLRPLPYPDPEELVAISTVWEGRDGKDQMAPPDVADLQTLSRSLESLVGYQPVSVTLTGMGDAEVIQAARVSGSLLETFGMSPQVGRDIRPEETGFGGQPVVVVSHRFWMERLGGASDVVGRTIQLSGVPLEVVGVAREGFDFPSGAQLWIPHIFSSPTSCGRACHTWWTVGRLRQGASLAGARTEIGELGEALAADYPETNARKRFVVVDLNRQGTEAVRARLWLLMAAVIVLLLIASTNAAHLLLMRTFSRRSEMALRSSLGGTRRRLAGLILSEAGILGVLGGGSGVLLALEALEVIRRKTQGMIPRAQEISLDGPILLLSLGLVVAVTLFSVWSPVLFLKEVSPAENLARERWGSASPGAGRRLRNGLVSVQIALSVVLLGGASLLLRSLTKLNSVDPGFDAENTLRFDLATRGSLEDVRIFFRTLEESLAALPSVEEAESVFGAPLGRFHVTARVSVGERGVPSPEEETLAGVRAVSPGYLELMRIPLLAGRRLLASDDVSDNPVAVVNRTFARMNFPNQDPLGQRVQVGTDQGYGSPVWTIVGIVGDIRSESLDQEPMAEIYVPHGQFGPSIMTLNVRTAGDPRAVLPAIREIVRGMDPNLPLRNVETAEEVLRRAAAPTRFLLFVVVAFAAVALALSMVGLYGVLAFLTARRTGEIGLRLALGAEPRKVLGLILREGIRITGVGLTVGLALSYGTAQLIRSLLYGVSPWDLGAHLLVLGILLPCALAAALIPAWRASQVDPAASLREE